MRILYVGGIHKKENRNASRFYSFASKIVHGLTRLGHHVLHFSDRDAKRECIFPILGRSYINKQLLKIASLYCPDVVFLHHADLITLDSIETLRAQMPRLKIAQINVDCVFNPQNIERVKSISNCVDASFITTHHTALFDSRCPGYYIPNPVDLSVESFKAFEHESDIDLFLAQGAFINSNDPRKILTDYIKYSLPQLNFYHSVASLDGGIWGIKYYQTLARSRMGLNLTRSNEKSFQSESIKDIYLYSSDRISQYMGNGLMTFSDRIYHLHTLFQEDVEMVFYESKEQLVEKIAYYMKNKEKAREIARCGWKKAHSSYSSTKVSSFILETLFETSNSEYAWPTSRL